VIRGVAPVYYRAEDNGTEYELWRGVVERVREGAAASALASGADVRSFYNHNPSAILGRTLAGTLALRDSTNGLEYEIVPPDTTAGRDAMESIRRGDVTGSSFMFRIVRETWEYIDSDDTEMEIRWLEEIDLVEVGPVALPAYSSSTSEVGRRTVDHLEEARASYDRYREGRAIADRDPLDRYRRRATIAEIGQ